MPGPDNGMGGQRVDLFMNGVDQLLMGSAGQIDSADGSDKQRVSGENMAVGVKAYPSRRVSGGMKHS